MIKEGILKEFTSEQYFAFDEKSECKHEFYYGKLYAMSGAPILHHQMCLRLFLHFFNLLSKKEFQIFVENVKVKIADEAVYLYPDIIITREQFHSMADYFVHSPILLTEVLSDGTRKYDSTDKFIQYQKISTLQYYLLIEPEKHVVLFYEKNESGDWTAKPFTDMAEVINFPLLNAQISLGDIYDEK